VFFTTFSSDHNVKKNAVIPVMDPDVLLLFIILIILDDDFQYCNENYSELFIVFFFFMGQQILK